MKSCRQLELETDIRSRHKVILTLADVGREIGINKRESVLKFLEGLPAYEINGRRRWRIADIARRLADYET